MSNTITLNGKEYKEVGVKAEGLTPIIAMLDGGLTYVGHTTLSDDALTVSADGFILLEDAQCIIRWWTGAHISLLAQGVCEGVELGAKADIRLAQSKIIQYFTLPFDCINDWKKAKIAKGKREVL